MSAKPCASGHSEYSVKNKMLKTIKKQVAPKENRSDFFMQKYKKEVEA